MSFRKLCLTAALVLFSMQTWTAAAPSLLIFDVPDSTGTDVSGINNRGDIIGVFFDAQTRPRPFVFTQGAFTTLDIAAGIVGPLGINDRGQIVGFTEMNIEFQGFIWDRGTATQITVPSGANTTYFHGINNRGQIVGHTRQTQFDLARAFLWDNEEFTFLDIPGVLVAGDGEDSMAINDRGQIVGTIQEGGITRGFLLADGEVTRISVPGASDTWATGINNRGEIVGVYRVGGVPSDNVYLRLPDRSFTSIEIPGSVSSAVRINDRGDIVGSFTDTAGKLHGFLWSH